MKFIKLLVLLFVSAFVATEVGAQANATLNMLTLNSGDVIQNGGSGTLRVTVGNTGPTSTIPAGRIQAQITLPASITLAPTASQPTNAGWTITVVNSQVANICNSSTTIPVNTQQNINVALVGGTTLTSGVITGQLTFRTNCTAPGSLAGNALADDQSTAGYQVVAGSLCNITGATSSATQIICNGGTSTLTVTAITSGTTGTLEYSIGGAYQSSNTFTVAAGSYTATVREVASPTCIGTAAALVVNQPTALAASSSAGTILCNSGTTTVVVSATGGTAPYTGTGTFAVSAGAYSYTVTDANGCTSTTSGSVSQPTALAASGSFSPICFGQTSTVTITATGGTAPYTGTGTFSQVAGTQSYTVTDANGCSTTASVTVTSSAAINAVAAVTTPISVIGGTGTITVTGGTSYVIISGTTINTTGASSGVFTGLLAGNYTFTATVGTCSAVSNTITLSNPAACTIAVSATAGTVLCNGGTTTLTATATGAIGAVEYSLNGGAFQSGNTFTVGAGSYTIVARETSRPSCSATATAVSVSQPTALAASGSFSAICFGGTSTVTISATGGTAPYTGTGTFSQVAGTQSYTVTDANGCSTSASVTVTQAALVATPVITSVNNGNNTFTLTASGFTGSLLWSTGVTTSSILVNAAATYTVTQTIGLCTSAAASQTVTLGNAIADPAVGQIFVTNLSDATVSANGLLFTQNYKLKLPVYNLNQFAAIPTSAINFKVDLGTKLQLAPSFNLATAPLSNYFTFTSSVVAGHQIITGVQNAEIPADFDAIAVFEVVGTLSCTSTVTSDIVITNSSASLTDEDLGNNNATLQYTLPVTVTATAVNVTCFGAANGNITVVASPGTTIVYTNAGGAVVTAPLAPGTYTVTASATGDAPLSNNCSTTATVTITQPDLLVTTTTGTTPNVCNGGNSGTITVASTGGTAPYTYTIAGPTVNTTGATSGVFTGLLAGSYTITSTDANGCTATTSAVVSQPISTVPDISLGSDISGSLYPTNGTSQTIVYNISEIAGNPAVGDTLRITKVAGFDITFNTALTSVVIAPTTYTLDNPNWKADNSNPAFVSLILKAAVGSGPGTINCGERVRIAITLTRNTTNISTFPLSARLRKANSELNLSNNFNSIIFTAE